MMKIGAVFAAVFLVWAGTLAAGGVDAVTSASYSHPPLPPVDERDLQDVVGEWLKTHWLLALATATPEGTPHASMVIYASERLTVYFRAETDTTKIEQIRRNPRVAYTVSDPVKNVREIRSLQVTGRAEILEGAERERVEGLLRAARGAEYYKRARPSGPGSAAQNPGAPDPESKLTIVAIRPLIVRWNDSTVLPGYNQVRPFQP